MQDKTLNKMQETKIQLKKLPQIRHRTLVLRICGSFIPPLFL